MRKVAFQVEKDYSVYYIEITEQTFRIKTELDPYLIPYSKNILIG